MKLSISQAVERIVSKQSAEGEYERGSNKMKYVTKKVIICTLP
jgi:hypothetical protein